MTLNLSTAPRHRAGGDIDQRPVARCTAYQTDEGDWFHDEACPVHHPHSYAAQSARRAGGAA